MDETDIVLNLPGLSVSVILDEKDCVPPFGFGHMCSGLRVGYLSGADSCMYFIERFAIGSCGSATTSRNELNRICTDRLKETVAHIDERCFDLGSSDQDSTFLEPLSFDLNHGAVVLKLDSISPGGIRYPNNITILKLSGFAAQYEVLQTYTPPSGPISFTVPAHPEGFERADWFDTYYIPLTHPLDWSLAQPLQCGYPTGAPDPGDYLTVADTAPPLSPGQGYFYVTAVNYNGERRYGRQRVGGVLSGRDPALLPECF